MFSSIGYLDVLKQEAGIQAKKIGPNIRCVTVMSQTNSC